MAKVDLLGKVTFDSRNSTLIYNGFGIINPFTLIIEGKGLSISRRFYADNKNEQDDLAKYNIITLNTFIMNTVVMDSLEMILSSDVLDRVAFRNERFELLHKDLVILKNQTSPQPDQKPLPIQIAALEKRMAELQIKDPENRRTNQIGTQVLVNYPLNAKTAFINNKTINPSADWPSMIWMGGWDADALGFNVKGFVQVILEE